MFVIFLIREGKARTMDSPIQIEFLGFEPQERERQIVIERIGKFEELFGRIVAGRISVKAPTGHHRTGGQYEATIRLKLPGGREVDVSRTPQADERHSDFAFAVNDAFKRAKRQLQQHAQRLQGDVKTHVLPNTGRVARLFGDHGFIEDAAELEIYFHRNSVVSGGFAKLTPGTVVSFVEAQGEKGPQASTVRLI